MSISVRCGQSWDSVEIKSRLCVESVTAWGQKNDETNF